MSEVDRIHLESEGLTEESYREKFDDFDDPDEYCSTCQGRGFIIDCCDDICANGDECIHGDGNVVCPTCHGENL